MEPLTTAALINAAAQAGMGLLSPEQQQQQQSNGNFWFTNLPGRQLAFDAIQRMQAGQGDFGFGSAYKQAMATGQQGLANRGIDPRSGVAARAQGDWLGQALAADATNRRQYGLNLMNFRPATQVASGYPANWPTEERDWHTRGIGTDPAAPVAPGIPAGPRDIPGGAGGRDERNGGRSTGRGYGWWRR